MKLQESDLTNRIHKESLLEKIKTDQENLAILLDWSLATEQPLGWRATWLLKQLVIKNDPRLTHYFQSVIDKFLLFNESQKREWLKILINQDVSEDEEGMLFDLCIIEWKKIQNHPALRSSAFHFIAKTIKKFP